MRPLPAFALMLCQQSLLFAASCVGLQWGSLVQTARAISCKIKMGMDVFQPNVALLHCKVHLESIVSLRRGVKKGFEVKGFSMVCLTGG